MKEKGYNKKISVLIADDNELILHSFSQVMRLKGFTAYTAKNGKKALHILSTKKVDIILGDIKLPGMNGIELLKIVKKQYPNICVIIITGYGVINDAVETIRNGASDYIFKPFTIDEAIEKILKVYKKRKSREVWKEIENTEREFHLPKVIAETDIMREVLEEIDIVAPTDATVLLTGETGTGKDALARLIHTKSKRKNQPFIRMNCSELNEGVIESELFGHEKGAFTGAVSRRIGKLELADKGTLFLDQISDIPLSTQKKLLRVLEQKEFERVGGTTTIKIDVRVIAATNKDITNVVMKKEFRRDLFYRLSTVIIRIPSLRERYEDIIPLAEHFLTSLTKVEKLIKLSKRVKDMFLSYKWPGNVCELKSTIKRAIIFSQGEDIKIDKQLTKRDSSDEVDGIFTGDSISLTVDDLEKSLLLRVLINAEWNIQHSARVLKISSTTLSNKIKKHSLDSYKEKDQLMDHH